MPHARAFASIAKGFTCRVDQSKGSRAPNGPRFPHTETPPASTRPAPARPRFNACAIFPSRYAASFCSCSCLLVVGGCCLQPLAVRILGRATTLFLCHQKIPTRSLKLAGLSTEACPLACVADALPTPNTDRELHASPPTWIANRQPTPGRARPPFLNPDN